MRLAESCSSAADTGPGDIDALAADTHAHGTRTRTPTHKDSRTPGPVTHSPAALPALHGSAGTPRRTDRPRAAGSPREACHTHAQQTSQSPVVAVGGGKCSPRPVAQDTVSGERRLRPPPGAFWDGAGCAGLRVRSWPPRRGRLVVLSSQNWNESLRLRTRVVWVWGGFLTVLRLRLTV